MSSWVGSWLQGRNDGDEEMKGDDVNRVDATPAVVPSADEIRRKRLERLQKLQEEQAAAAAAAAPTASNASEAAPAATNAAAAPVAAVPAPTSSSTSTAAPPSSTTTAPSASTTTAPSASTVVKKRSVNSARTYVNDMLQRLLQLTLSPTVAAADPTLYYVADVAATVDDNDARMLSADNVSEALYARIVADPSTFETTSQPLAAIEFLEQSFYRCRDELQKLQSPYIRLAPADKQAAEACVMNVREMCVNYSATALTEPDFVPIDGAYAANAQAFNALVRAQRHALTPEFVDAVALALDATDATATAQVFAPIFRLLVAELFAVHPPSLFSDVCYRNVTVLTALCRTKALAGVFATLDGFLLTTPPLTGRRLEDATALGIVLRFCAGQDPAVAQLFANITKRTKTDVDHSVHSLQTKLTGVHNNATELVTVLLKAGGATRENVLKWIETAVSVNVERAKENPDMLQTSSDGMMLNLTAVLLQLCRPFMPPTAKAHLINATYLATQNAVFPFDATKLLGHTSTSDTRSLSIAKSPFNFITRCYFASARAVHLGPVSAIGHYMRVLRQLSYVQSRMNGDVANADPRLRTHFDALVTSKMVLDAELLHPDVLDDLLRFVLLSCTVVTAICVNGDRSIDDQLELPLPDPAANALLAHVPEHLVDDICTILIFVARLQPKALQPVALDKVLQLIIVVLATPAYVRSPHLRAKMSEVLFRVFLPTDASDERETAGTAGGMALLTTNALAQQHLAPCLLALYGDVEATGFYEKLEHRYNIACLLKFLWQLPAHKAAFVRIAADTTAFVKFAHGLMNHINGLVTDALIGLPEIKGLQEEMLDVPRWMALDEPTREQKQSLLADKERTVTSSLQLANETIHMLSYLTSEIREPFVEMPELEERLVSMLNSVLVKLAGPRGLELKVSNPEQYKFRPKVMLQEIVETLLHFADYPSFQHAVATNGYYDGPVFGKCATILERTQLLPPAAIQKFETFVAQVAIVAASALSLEETLGEIPDEFLDPLMCTLMKDPVVLPTSGYSMDRATITQHLLNDQSDPFTRAPLTVEQLTPNVALKAKIEQWIRDQQQKQKEEQ